MALLDYHQCAVCSGKAFYDANIDCPRYVSSWDTTEREFGYTQVKAICSKCTATHELRVTQKAAETDAD